MVSSTTTLRKQFLNRSFQLSLVMINDEHDPRLRLAGLPVKHAGMALPDPTASAKPYCEASTLVNVHVFVLAAFVFHSSDHTVRLEVRGPSLSQNPTVHM
jgi:hypothetical protein